MGFFSALTARKELLHHLRTPLPIIHLFAYHTEVLYPKSRRALSHGLNRNSYHPPAAKAPHLDLPPANLFLLHLCDGRANHNTPREDGRTTTVAGSYTMLVGGRAAWFSESQLRAVDRREELPSGLLHNTSSVIATRRQPCSPPQSLSDGFTD